jgi:hypothetical protein
MLSLQASYPQRNISSNSDRKQPSCQTPVAGDKMLRKLQRPPLSVLKHLFQALLLLAQAQQYQPSCPARRSDARRCRCRRCAPSSGSTWRTLGSQVRIWRCPRGLQTRRTTVSPAARAASLDYRAVPAASLPRLMMSTRNCS